MKDQQAQQQMQKQELEQDDWATAGLVDADDSNLLANAEKDIRNGFIRKVYGILVVMLMVTVGVASPIVTMTSDQVVDNLWIIPVSLVGIVATFILICCCEEALRKFPINYIIVGVISVSYGLLVGFISSFYTIESVMLTAGVTCGIFLSLTLLACFCPIDFTGWLIYGFAALIGLLIFGCTISIMAAVGFDIVFLRMVYSLVAIILFSFFIIMDTQMIIGGSHKHQFGIDDYCFAALNLYLDIIQIFLQLLTILGDRS